MADAAAHGGHTPRGQAQREALVRAAFELIAERGFEGLRTRDVAARGHVNIATLHYYFATKEDLIRAVVLKMKDDFSNVHPLYGEPGAEEPLEELRRELSDAEYQARTIPATFTVFFELFLRGLRDAAIRAILQSLDIQWQEHISTYLADGVREGVFRADLDVPTTAAALTTFIKGSLAQALLHGDDYPMRAVHAQVESWLTEYARAKSAEHRHSHPQRHSREVRDAHAEKERDG
ncbi:MAG TPA: TetR/AcrR family transcriptional regulator [Ktedonobacterales bacterium]|nr:TetR/AcrR family transcriptional regulator [Ktedonobacterales bacterium]